MEVNSLPVFSWHLTFIFLLAVMLLRYFLLVAPIYWLVNKINNRNKKRFIIESPPKDNLQNRKDILWSVLSSGIFALSGTFMVKMWQAGELKIYHDWRFYGAWYFFLSPFILMVLHDTYFYWTHRWLHHPRWFKRWHKVHHESRTPTAWTAFAFHPGEAFIQALFLPVIFWMMPVHWFILIFFLGSMSVLGVINHLGSEFYPAAFRRNFPFCHLVNATHHQLHHQKMNYNLGLYFNFWDLIMETEHE
jgi:Delta7-sterol 5-desaturase